MGPLNDHFPLQKGGLINLLHGWNVQYAYTN